MQRAQVLCIAVTANDDLAVHLLSQIDLEPIPGWIVGARVGACAVKHVGTPRQRRGAKRFAVQPQLGMRGVAGAILTPDVGETPAHPCSGCVDHGRVSDLGQLLLAVWRIAAMGVVKGPPAVHPRCHLTQRARLA